MRATFLLLLLATFEGAFSVQTTHAAESNHISEADAVFFETFIRPTLVADCMECHGSEKQKGGLRLDSRPGWQKGGDSGAAILPHDPEGSLLLRSIRHLEPDLKMPDKAPKLDDKVLQNFALWIQRGAPDPRDAPPTIAATKPTWPDLLAARRSWWSLQPLSHPQPPAGPSKEQTSLTSATTASSAPTAAHSQADNQNFVHPVDRFLNDALSKAALPPAELATPEVLVRRLHFLLTGLPPKPEDVRSFCTAHAQNPKQALRECSQKLLDSPAFGEHWARHWMDLVRYAESHGSEGDPEIPGAFQYRDYLIRAFNADVPLDQLIREHLAGDLLPNPRLSPSGINESRIGPAHLRMVEHGYQPVDTLDDQIKAVDNQIDVVTKAFQGLTVSCARCHDHKFDAISQRDYTALYGIFSSVRPAQVPIDSDERLQLSAKADLASLKATIRKELADHWLSQIADLPQLLAKAANPSPNASTLELQTKLRSVERSLAEMQWQKISADRPRQAPAPYALWAFALGEDDQFGHVHSELIGGAKVQDGHLILAGNGAFLKSAPLPDTIAERTYEVWLTTNNLTQHGGGIVGLEQIATHAFDSLVYGEKMARKWLAGSNNHRRSEQTDGVEENVGPGEKVHLAITYAADGTISVFRNGLPYGQPYRKDALHVFPAADTRLLLGLRHTGAGNGFFEGKIQEVRLFNRALSKEEIAASFAEGPLAETRPAPTPSKQAKLGLDSPQNAQDELKAEAAALQAEIARLTPVNSEETFTKLTAKAEHPLHLAAKAATLPPEAFAKLLPEYRSKLGAQIAQAKEFNASNFQVAWDLSGPDAAQWFNSGPDATTIPCGDFRIAQDGATLFDSLLPAGIAASTLVPQFGGVSMSPDFRLTSESVSIRFAAINGAMLRIIPDNYPLGSGSIFPRAIVQRKSSAWTRLDTSYRVNCNSYMEFSTPGHQTRRAEPPKGSAPFTGSDAFFVVEKVVFHSGKDAPKEVYPALEMLLNLPEADTSFAYLAQLRACLRESIKAWREGALSEAQRELLDACLQSRILVANSDATPSLSEATARFKNISKALPTPAFTPGVLEHKGKDAALLARGDHKSPGDIVPRAYLEVLNPQQILSEHSGRAELAERVLAKDNPLTARIMANRIWLWTFSAGIVPTPDNFGRMGEKPTHPELLDFLAGQLQEGGWSLKKMLAYLVSTEAFQRSSRASELATQKDPANALLSHAHVRRLEAESIRDALLSISGALNPLQLGTSVAQTVPRRSVYLQQRRNSLPALLTTFDAPKPFTTLGRRDSTTVPAQSLTLLNDPAVLQLAKRWSESMRAKNRSNEANISEMFEAALGHPPTPQETAQALALLADSGHPEDLTPLAHAIFNLKEFIYLK